MKQSLQLRTSQHLALTPQLQQSIRLLQLSTLELHQELEQLLTDNPLLERLDDPLDHSVRLLADGAIGSSAAPAEAPPEPGAQDAPAPAEAETFDAPEGDSASSNNDNDGEWGDLGRA
ncbi:MAG: RNA polymerase factor sigma-54, partial [Massilia sp.]